MMQTEVCERNNEQTPSMRKDDLQAAKRQSQNEPKWSMMRSVRRPTNPCRAFQVDYYSIVIEVVQWRGDEVIRPIDSFTVSWMCMLQLPVSKKSS